MSNDKNQIITVDTTFEQVLEYDATGLNIVFSAKKGQFKVLSDDEVLKLSAKSRQKYHITKELYDEALVDEPVAEVADLIGAGDRASLIDTGYGLKLSQDAGSAAQRLEFSVDKGRDKNDYFYARAEDVERQVRTGASVATSGVQSWGNKGNGVHRLTKRGHDTLVLMHKEKRTATYQAEVEARYAERTSATDREHSELVQSVSGVKAVNDAGIKYRDIE